MAESRIPTAGDELVLGYARVSVAHEDVNNQVAAIREYCGRRGYRLLKVFTDVITGASRSIERPGFKRMLEVAEELGIRKIVVFDVSRLGRNLMDVVETLRELQRRGLVVEFVRHPELNTGDPVIFNTLVYAFALAAELERQALRERMEAARRAGKRIGRKPTPIPIDEVRRLLRQGLSLKTIWRILVAEGKLRYVEKGREKHLSYEQFRRRVRELLHEKK